MALVQANATFAVGANPAIPSTLVPLTVDEVIGFSYSIPPSTTNMAFSFPSPHAKLQFLGILATGVLTIQDLTSSPNITWVTAQNVPAVWVTGSPFANPQGTTDVTTLYVTNATSAAIVVTVTGGRTA